MQRTILIITLAAFSVLSALALWHHGYWGLIAPQLQTLGTGQVLADLVISLGLVMIWMWRNATSTGRNPSPWFVLALAAGSFGPLIYLLTQPGGKRAA